MAVYALYFHIRVCVQENSTESLFCILAVMSEHSTSPLNGFTRSQKERLYSKDDVLSRIKTGFVLCLCEPVSPSVPERRVHVPLGGVV